VNKAALRGFISPFIVYGFVQWVVVHGLTSSTVCVFVGGDSVLSDVSANVNKAAAAFRFEITV
jgi:hypothetical protein